MALAEKGGVRSKAFVDGLSPAALNALCQELKPDHKDCGIRWWYKSDEPWIVLSRCFDSAREEALDFELVGVVGI